jgi:hypothetical protein
MIGEKAFMKKVRLSEEVLDDMEWTREERLEVLLREIIEEAALEDEEDVSEAEAGYLCIFNVVPKKPFY